MSLCSPLDQIRNENPCKFLRALGPVRVVLLLPRHGVDSVRVVSALGREHVLVVVELADLDRLVLDLFVLVFVSKLLFHVVLRHVKLGFYLLVGVGEVDVHVCVRADRFAAVPRSACCVR